MDFRTTYGRPIQGVSKQPPKVRNEGQCTAQVNCTPSAVDGLKTRVGSSLKAVIPNAVDKDSYVYTYQRDNQEEYLIAFQTNADPLILGLDGTVMNYTASPEASAYMGRGSAVARKRFTASTIGDYTFLVNREVPVSASSEMTETADIQAVITVGLCNYGRTYEVVVDGVSNSYTTPNGGTASDTTNIDTTYVASQIYDDMDNNLTGFTISRHANYIFIKKDDGSDFTISTRDGSGGNDLVLVKGSVDALDKVPARAPEGMQIQVAPNGATDDSIIYLLATSTDGDRTLWKETTQQGIPKGFDVNTMPFNLIRDSVDEGGVATFHMEVGDWADREVGDNDSNPLPSFVDSDIPKPITSIGTFQNRLYVTGGENLVMSRTDEYFNFYRYSAQRHINTDPIDIFSDTSSVNVLNSSAKLNGNLVLLSDYAQFGMSGLNPQTYETATLREMTSYECVSTVKPASSGENIYIAFNYGDYAGIREMYVEEVTDTVRARPITDHVDNYIEGEILQMAASTNVNTLFLLSEGARNKLYVYDWLFNGNEKVQSAWHEWVWPEGFEIVGISFVRDKLYVLSVYKDTYTVLEEFNMSEPLEYELPFNIKLDRHYPVDFTYNLSTGYWQTAQLSYPQFIDANTEIVGIDNDDPDNNGITVPAVWDEDNEILYTDYPLSEDTGRSVGCIVGSLYDATYEPTPPQLKDYQGNVTSLSKPIVGVLYFNFDEAYHYDVTVDDDIGGSNTTYYNNRFIGHSNNVVGFSPIGAVIQDVAVRRQADKVKFRLHAKSHVGFQLREIEWTGISNPSKTNR